MRLRNLPPFPPVASKLIVLFRRQDSNFRDAVSLMKSDASITAEVLRLANSASVGLRFPVTNLLQALSTLGVNRLVSLTTTLCVGKLLKSVANLPVMRMCWRNNLATALIASKMSSQFDVDAEKAYTFGLLSGIGRLGLLVSDPQLYTHLAMRAERERLPFDVLERELFGCDHIEAGDCLIRQWKLPPEMATILFGGTPMNGSDARLAQLIREAGEEAKRAGFGVIEMASIGQPDSSTFEIVKQVNQIEQSLGI
ncbi:MAG TPA: HDOD domain-containing protein [Bryobacteraceae bacterium]